MTGSVLDTRIAEKTLELLWARVRTRGDLPGFSKVINSIIGAMRGDNDAEFNMTKTVLSDPALTQRVLRLANSAMYSVFGGGINTVSKAVTVLGTETIGHLALGLKLIDGLSTTMADTPGTRGELEKAVLAGHIGRQVAASASSRDAEEAVVCSMLHTLGRLMVTFYLPESWSEIQSRRENNKHTEEEVSRELLGMTLEEIGRSIARQWGFPTTLINSMVYVHPKAAGEPIDHGEWLATISTVSTRCADAICQSDGANTAELSRIVSGYADMLGVEPELMLAAVDTALGMIEEEAVISRPIKLHDGKKEIGSESHKSIGKPANAAELLARGVTDVRGAMHNSNTTQLMTMALETVFKGLGLSRAVAFVRNTERHVYLVRLGFGEGTHDLIDNLTFPDAYQPDVFHAALANDKMIFIENAHATAFASKLPRWWKGALFDARGFMVLPMAVGRNPVGFIYGDWDLTVPPAKIEATEIAPLDELRHLLVTVIDQRRNLHPRTGKAVF
jgi:HD-like signal output (HDOD) protein